MTSTETAAKPNAQPPVSPSGPSFLAQVLSGTAKLDDIDDAVDAWHAAPGNASTAGISLRDTLGMTAVEYAEFMHRPAAVVEAAFNRALAVNATRFVRSLSTLAEDIDAQPEALVLGAGRLEHNLAPVYITLDANGKLLVRAEEEYDDSYVVVRSSMREPMLTLVNQKPSPFPAKPVAETSEIVQQSGAISREVAVFQDAVSQFRPGIFKHRKSGGTYLVLASGNVVGTAFNGCTSMLVTIYLGTDGKLWVRDTAEFYDGRFKVVFGHDLGLSLTSRKDT